MSSQLIFTDASSNHDFILDASDGVRLYVLKSFLSYSSDFFKNLYGEIGSSPVPILKIAERGCTMLTIVPFCYPGTPPPPNSFDGLVDTLLTIRKYLMQDIETRVEAALLASQLTTNEPLRIFAIAIHCKWEGLARGAAKQALRLPLRDELPFVPELTLIPASAYHLAVDALDPPTFFYLIRPSNPSTCSACEERLVRQTVVLPNGSSGDAHGHQWNFTYAEALREQVRRTPGRVRLEESSGLDNVMEAATKCPLQRYSVVINRIEAVVDILERLIEQVCGANDNLIVDTNTIA
ncbi:hypothetical protein CPB85DRAFT_1361452 [Mucidula mucida]|nr:hypothetical protein CPB85DRAFT_1361452 [Mucidula mucida]